MIVERPPIDRAVVPHGTPLRPPRPGVRYVRAPVLGIVIADDHLRSRINRRFHWPMIILALLVLPVLAIELFIQPATWTLLWWINSTAMVLIWLAFLVEFIVKVAIAECRIEYCRRNWLDILIILMPAFRPLRVAYLARTSRVFTLRGVAMKFARYLFTIVVGLEATERLLHRFGLRLRDQRRPPEEMTRHQLTQEVKRLRKLADRWEAWYLVHQQYLAEHGRDPLPPSRLHDEAQECGNDPHSSAVNLPRLQSASE